MKIEYLNISGPVARLVRAWVRGCRIKSGMRRTQGASFAGAGSFASLRMTRGASRMRNWAVGMTGPVVSVTNGAVSGTSGSGHVKKRLMGRCRRRRGFTLVELLVVIAVTAVLMGILVPVLTQAREQARGVVCRSNMRQLVLAGIGYATENDGYYVPAARDMWDDGGLCRWHGVREEKDGEFVAAAGPLAGYLSDGKVSACPERVAFAKSQTWEDSFEKGCGGYGYNMTYIGSRMWEYGASGLGFRAAYERTTRMAEVRRPGETVMFADAAMSRDGVSLIEYSFVEPPFMVFNGRPMEGYYMSPSIHFRHDARANVGWADGSIGQKEMGEVDRTNAYGVDSGQMALGWFSPVDNSLFDLE